MPKLSDEQVIEIARDIRSLFSAFNLTPSQRAGVLLSLGVQELQKAGFPNAPATATDLLNRIAKQGHDI